MERRRILGSLVEEDCMGVDFVAEEMKIMARTEGGYLLESFDWLVPQLVDSERIGAYYSLAETYITFA